MRQTIKYKETLLGLFFLFLPALSHSQEFPFPSDSTLKNLGMVRIDSWEGVQTQVHYSTEQNFLKTNVYKGYSKIWLHKMAANKLKKVISYLKTERPDLNLLVYDGLRPRSVQFIMRKKANEMGKGIYVARASIGSIHNFGQAIDLTLCDLSGVELDMGTPYDYFGPKAQPRKEDSLVKAGKLSLDHIRNRKLLRSIMHRAGWRVLATEWWHFNAFSLKYTRKTFTIVE